MLLSLPSSLSLAGSRSGSPGRVLASTALSTLSTGAQRVSAAPTSQRRSRIPRSQGCSRDSSPTRLSVGKHQPLSLISASVHGSMPLVPQRTRLGIHFFAYVFVINNNNHNNKKISQLLFIVCTLPMSSVLDFASCKVNQCFCSFFLAMCCWVLMLVGWLQPTANHFLTTLKICFFDQSAIKRQPCLQWIKRRYAFLRFFASCDPLQ